MDASTPRDFKREIRWHQGSLCNKMLTGDVQDLILIEIDEGEQYGSDEGYAEDKFVA